MQRPPGSDRAAVSRRPVRVTFATACSSVTVRNTDVHTMVVPDGQSWAHVHQAVGMIAEQIGCTVDEALERLFERAREIGQTVEHTALDVIDREMRFEAG